MMMKNILPWMNGWNLWNWYWEYEKCLLHVVLSGIRSGSVCRYERGWFSEIKATCCAFFFTKTISSHFITIHPSHPWYFHHHCRLAISFYLLSSSHFDHYHHHCLKDVKILVTLHAGVFKLSRVWIHLIMIITDVAA